MSIKAVTAGYAGGSDLWYMTPDGDVEIATIGEEVPYPYFYSDTKLEGYGIADSNIESIRILHKNSIEEKRMWKVELHSPSDTKRWRDKAKATAEDDIIYIERRLGADGGIEWVPPKRISYMDIESEKKTQKLELVGSLVGDKYEPFRTAGDYFQFLEDDRVAASTAWNGDHYDFRILGGFGNERWSRTLQTDSMTLYAKFNPKHMRRGLDVVARREKVGQKLDEAVVGQLAYNENDCRIMQAIIKKWDLMGTMFSLSAVTGVIPKPDEQRAIAMFENYLMKNRSKYQRWLEGKHQFTQKGKDFQGALILYGTPGIYDGVAMFDYTSLYPSVVMYSDFKGEGEEAWRTIQEVERDWVGFKEKYGLLGMKSMREAFKVLANATYGIFANEGFRYSSREIAAFVTAQARQKLTELRGIVEEMGFVPLVSDTDSCSVQVPKEKVQTLLKIINRRISPYVVKVEYYGQRFIMFAGEGGKAVKKRYAVLTDDGDLIVKGLEMVRNDWSPWSRDFQERLLRTMMETPVELMGATINRAVALEKERFLAGQLPVGEVAVTKSIDLEKEYKVKTQHVRAYEQLKDKSEGVIGFVTYWIGRDGQPFVRNDLTDEQVRARLDWPILWHTQAAPIVKRLKSSYQKTHTLELYL